MNSLRRALIVTLAALPLMVFAAAAEKPAKPLHLSKGEPVDIQKYVVKGKTTIFDFYSDFCPPCVAVAPQLEKMHASLKDVVVVKVDINRPGLKGIDWKSPVAQQYRLQAIPHFKIFGPDGSLQAEGEKAIPILEQFMAKLR